MSTRELKSGREWTLDLPTHSCYIKENSSKPSLVPADSKTIPVCFPDNSEASPKSYLKAYLGILDLWTTSSKRAEDVCSWLGYPPKLLAVL